MFQGIYHVWLVERMGLQLGKLRNQMDSFWIFCKENLCLCISLYVWMLLLYGKHAFTTNSLYDTDDVIFFKNSTLNWLEIGRQGAVLTKKLFGLLWFNPYFTGALCLVLFPSVVIIFCYLFYMAGLKKGGAALWVFSFVFMASPVWVFQFYFTVQWFEFAWAMLLMAAVAGMFQAMFAEKGWAGTGRKRRLGLFGLEVLLSVWVFSTYQAFVPMFLALCAGMYLVSLEAEERWPGAGSASDAGSVPGADVGGVPGSGSVPGADVGSVFDAGEYLRRLGWMAGVFLAAFLLNTVVTDRFFMDSDYISGQVAWKWQPAREILHGLAVYFVKCHTGMSVPYSWMMGAGLLLVFLDVCRVAAAKERSVWYKLLYAAAAAGVWLAAHMLVLYAGAATVIRSQIVYPFTVAFLAMFLVQRSRQMAGIRKRRGLQLVLALLVAAGLWGELGDTFRLHYTEDMKDKMDRAVAQRVIDQINQLGCGAEPQMPVVFVGDYAPRLNRACVAIDENMLADMSVGVSCWWRVNAQPNRLARMMENHFGVSYIRPDWDTVTYAREISRDMPAYPDAGYVQVREGLVIVKMSDVY